MLRKSHFKCQNKNCLPVTDHVWSCMVIYGCENWTIKKAECRRVDAFELWCWRRLLRIHWTAKRSNQSILKEINPEYSLEWLMLKWKLQYFGHWMQRANPLENILMMGKIEGRRGREWQRMRWFHWLNGHEFERALGDNGGQESLVCCSPWGPKESDTTWQLNNSKPKGDETAMGWWRDPSR